MRAVAASCARRQARRFGDHARGLLGVAQHTSRAAQDEERCSTLRPCSLSRADRSWSASGSRAVNGCRCRSATSRCHARRSTARRHSGSVGSAYSRRRIRQPTPGPVAALTKEPRRTGAGVLVRRQGRTSRVTGRSSPCGRFGVDHLGREPREGPLLLLSPLTVLALGGHRQILYVPLARGLLAPHSRFVYLR